MKKVIGTIALIGLASSFEDNELIVRPVHPYIRKHHTEDGTVLPSKNVQVLSKEVKQLDDDEFFAANDLEFEDMGNLELFSLKNIFGGKKKPHPQPQPQQPQYSNGGYQLPTAEQSYEHQLFAVESNDDELFGVESTDDELFSLKKIFGGKKKPPQPQPQPQPPQYSNGGYQLPTTEQSFEHQLFAVDSTDDELFSLKKIFGGKKKPQPQPQPQPPQYSNGGYQLPTTEQSFEHQLFAAEPNDDEFISYRTVFSGKKNSKPEPELQSESQVEPRKEKFRRVNEKAFKNLDDDEFLSIFGKKKGGKGDKPKTLPGYKEPEQEFTSFF